MNKEIDIETGEILPGVTWVRTQGKKTDGRFWWDTNNGLVLYGKDPNFEKLNFALQFIGGNATIFIKEEKLFDLVERFPGIATEALLPNSGLEICTRKPDNVILDELTKEQKEEVLKMLSDDTGGFMLINPDVRRKVYWTKMPNRDTGGH